MRPSELIRVYRPCGACGHHVPAATGCKHWRPAQTETVARNREKVLADNKRRRQARWLGGLSPQQAAEQREKNRQRAADSRQRVQATMTEQDRAELRERNRLAQEKSRQLARERVASMGKDYR